MKRYLLALAVLPTMAAAQTAWNENVIQWDAPTACTSGQPVANCAVQNYQVERSSTTTGTFTFVGTTTALTYTHTVPTSGPTTNCYRVIAVAATGQSAPSNVACKTNTPPAGPPNPPTNLRFTIAVAALGGMSPVYSVSANGETVNTFYGLLPAGRECMKDYPVKGTLRGLKFYRIAFNPRELWGVPPAGVNLAAACA